jgi:hypothetical protein
MIDWISRRRAQAGGDAGYGLILVMGLLVVMTIMITTLFVIVQNSLAGSYNHQKFDTALATAESGIDQTLARLQTAYVNYGTDFPVPDTSTNVDPSPVCSGDPTSYKAPSGGFASASAERAWANTTIAQEIAANPNCLLHGTDGDYAVLKPSNRQTIYSESWTPAYGATNSVTRLIKAEYLFSPYAPSNAVLTGCNLAIGASTTVQSIPGADPTLAAVHSNCTVSVPQGNPTVTGPVSSTGSSSDSSNKFTDNAGGKVISGPVQSIPVISAKEVYAQQEANYTGSWYDMCPDGTVRSPSSSGPCTGNVLSTLAAGGGQWRGFQYEGLNSDGSASWNLKSGAGDGVYYFQGGTITMGTGLGNPTSNAVTIIAAAATAGQCLPVGGTISWDHDNIAAPAMTNLFMLADHNLITGSNFSAGGVASNGTVNAGMFVAGDQMDMSTSSNGAYGSVLAGDQCTPVSTDPFYVPVNKIDNPSIYYDPNAKAPFTDIIDTTLWLEYAGG